MKLENVIAERDNKTVYRDGDRSIKIFSPQSSKAAILNEALNQAIVEEAGMNVPAILSFYIRDGKPVTESEYIDGETLDRVIKNNPDKFDEYFNLFVDLQIELQSKSSRFLTRLRDKLNRQINEAELSATVRYSLHARLSAMPKSQQICHGDFNPSNIILDKDGKAYILDWSKATQGNAAADAAMTCILFCLDGEIETARKYVDLYCKKTGTEKSFIKKWIPIVAASYSVEVSGEKHDKLIAWVESFDLLD